MLVPLDSKTLRRSLRAGIVDGSSYSVMVGLGETYLPAFVLALGHGQVAAGLTATLPMLAGSVLQLSSPPFQRWVRSHRWWTVAAVVLQSLCFLPLTFAALRGSFPWWGVLLLATWYWGAGLTANPTWNAWMSRIIPPDVRARYFGVRTPITQVFLFASLLIGGWVLQRHDRAGQALVGFAWIFAVAGAFRLISGGFLWAQADPGRLTEQEQASAPWGTLKLKGSPASRLIFYMLAMQAATQLAVPFLTPYMLRELHFQYIEYVYLLAAAYLARVIMSPLFGKWAHRWGAKRLLWVGGISLAPAGLLWMPLPREEYRLVYLIVVQFATGTAFAAYELATLLMLFETLPNHERAGILTTYNCLNALATVGGSVLGGALLRLAGEQRMAYLLVFGASSLARVLTLPLLRSVLERPLWWRTTAPPAIQSTDR